MKMKIFASFNLFRNRNKVHTILTNGVTSKPKSFEHIHIPSPPLLCRTLTSNPLSISHVKDVIIEKTHHIKNNMVYYDEFTPDDDFDLMLEEGNVEQNWNYGFTLDDEDNVLVHTYHNDELVKSAVF